METIDDIVGDIRAQNQGLSEDGYALSPLVADLLGLADRIEAAHKREIADALDTGAFVEATRKRKNESVTDCNGLNGNGAKMREAIDRCVNLITEFGNAEIVKTHLDVIIDIEVILKAALRSAPPRNCDKFSKAEVLEMLNDCSFSKEDTIEWLYEAKGECDEHK